MNTAIRIIYRLMLIHNGEVTQCHRIYKTNAFKITIAVFDDPNKRSIIWDDHCLYYFSLSPEESRYIRHENIENEMWSHY